MSFISSSFFFFSVIAILFIRFPSRIITRHWRILLLNIWFISSYFQTLASFLPLLSFIILGYISLYSIAHWKKTTIATLCVAIVILVFAWVKQYAAIILLERALGIEKFAFMSVGLSYILFRILHLIIDIHQSGSKAPGIVKYINYCLFFPNFVSGPIQRYEDFNTQMSGPLLKFDTDTLHKAMCRFFQGIIMILVISALADKLGTWCQSNYYSFTSTEKLGLLTLLNFSAASLLYLINIYANFSGYMHIVIGVGLLAGFSIPENFNRPYLAKNFLDLWARWHITLSEWFKLYLFNPVLKAMAKRWDSPSLSPYFGAFSFFVTFLVMGIWHGTSFMFVFYGLFLGLGAMLNKAWQVALADWIGKKPYKALTQHNWYFQISRSLTLSYFAIALICLWFEPNQLSIIGKRYFLGQGALAFLLLTITIILISIVIEVLSIIIGRVRSCFPKIHISADTSMIVGMAIRLFIIINVLGIAGGNAPEFIYKAF
ncbi:MBOAT family O-acyltransferase [Dickeya oryzae]|uniref:MBOAT family O-acyltransferase n=1 Tax=Dickeya oryzae TaxID=1240404 RepID=UPI0003A001EE|nr:MBOAT family O-acyltransferase [Dickeya oryzae]